MTASTEQENPFVKKGKQESGSESKPTKRGRPPNTPSFDHVISAIGRGEYDDELIELRQAITERNEARRERVMLLVHEVFGEDAVIEFTKSSNGEGMEGDFMRSRMGVVPEPIVDESAGAPFPQPEVTEPVASPDNGGGDLDVQLDSVEARMEAEAAVESGTQITDPNAPQTEVPVSEIPIEDRSARVGGLAPSDMGE